MTPSERKDKSEAALRAMGIAVNENLPLIESTEEIQLRTKDELKQRIVALWALAGTAHLPDNDFFRSYLVDNQLTGWLSSREHRYLVEQVRPDKERVHFSWQVESLFFLGWCGGLVREIAIPTSASSVGSFMNLFPHERESLTKLDSALALRSANHILDWSDLLYRLHWAVREHRHFGRPLTHQLVPGAVQEWHRAANWMIGYEGEDDWDKVGTDT
jgi:hypothetical protein